MRISVFGLGYVGCVTAACLAKQGHQVLGVDMDKNKVDAVNSCRSPIIEDKVQRLIEEAVARKRLVAVTNAKSLAEESELSLICVGTPSSGDGSADLTHIVKVCQHIGLAIFRKNGFHVVAVRSTVPPGTTAKIVIPTLEKHSGKKAGVDFGVCVNPEFLREGSSVYDFHNPPFTLIGQSDGRSGNVVAKVFHKLKSPVIRTKPEVAEMVKYVNNAFHALKIGFANEVGNLCKGLDIDSHKVMAIFCRDSKLNLSPYYLKPGFAFGGSCLSKDLRALIHEIGRNNLLSPILSSILPSNDNQIERGANLILETGKRKIGILGLSFKAGTDDLRESPMVKLVSLLIERGLKVRIYDGKVAISKLLGANKEYIEREIPHIASLMCPLCEEVVKKSEVIVVGHRTEEFEKIVRLLKPDQILIDLVRIVQNPTQMGSYYRGICW